jgi:2-polyprenyl-6-methoxyphenol hydroxylase-like FAD-dependent oxidoreductase
MAEETPVLIAGAGPSGLALAVTLACRSIKAMLIDKAERGQDTSRAIVLHPGSLLALEPIGVTPLLIERGLRTTKLVIGTPTRTLLTADFGSLPPPYPFALTIPQNETEAVLRKRLSVLGGSVEWDCELIDVKQDANGVDVVIRCADEKREVRASYLVGADGYHSKVRETLNSKFHPGTYPVSVMLGDVQMSWPRPENEDYFYLVYGRFLIVAALGSGYYRLVADVEDPPAQPSRNDLQNVLDARAEGLRCFDQRGTVGVAFPYPSRLGRSLAFRPHLPCRRRSACAQPGGRPGHEHQHAGYAPARRYAGGRDQGREARRFTG